MGFQPGNKLSKGRPKGALNRSTEMTKLTIARATNKVLDNLPTMLDKMMKENPKEAIDIAVKLLEYTLPKMSRMEVKGEIEQRIQQISVNIAQKSPDELRD